MVMPPTVLATTCWCCWGAMAGRLAARHVRHPPDLHAHRAVIAATVVAFPLVFARARPRGGGPAAGGCARVLGISGGGVFWRVTLPLAWRGILAGVLLGFARAGRVGATLMVAGSYSGKTQTLSIAVYEAVQAGRDDVANLLVLITGVCVAVLLAVGKPGAGRATGNERFVCGLMWIFGKRCARATAPLSCGAFCAQGERGGGGAVGAGKSMLPRCWRDWYGQMAGMCGSMARRCSTPAQGICLPPQARPWPICTRTTRCFRTSTCARTLPSASGAAGAIPRSRMPARRWTAGSMSLACARWRTSTRMNSRAGSANARPWHRALVAQPRALLL